MRKLIVAFILLSTLAAAQVPNKMSFQTVVRNSLGKLEVNKSIGVRASILKGSANGTIMYAETHQKMSNVNGLLSLEIGGGTSIQGTFNDINWSDDSYFIKTELDLTGGANYTISGVTEFVSVPYAKMADKSIKSGSSLYSDTSNYTYKSKLAQISDTSNQVRILKKGENVGDMNFWNGTTWVPLSVGAEGQTLTIIGGKPTWTILGANPGLLTSIDCSTVTNNGTLEAFSVSNGVSSIIKYNSRNGGEYIVQTVNSTGVLGLTANLSSGSYSNGNGSVTFTITGTPVSSGIANFLINIGGNMCTLTRTVNSKPIKGYGPNISDVDGNSYKTVYIGIQQWIGENLKTTKYSDGTSIPNINDNTQWSNNTTGAWCYYNNDIANNAKYGKLYNWYAVSNTTNGNKNICPTGWHVPSDDEWTILINYLGGSNSAANRMSDVYSLQGSNTSLFTALPGGIRYNGLYELIGSRVIWWSTSEDIDWYPSAYHYYITNKNVANQKTYKSSGISVRCLKD